MRCVLLLCCLVGCGLAEGGIVTPDGVDAARLDGSLQTDGLADALSDQVAPDAPALNCDPNKPFGSTVGVVEINTAGQNESLRTFGGGLSAVFASTRPNTGGWDLFFTSRTSTSSPYAPAVNGGQFLNTTADEVNGTVTDDGLTIYFARKTGPLQIFQAKRTLATDPFGVPAQVPFITGGSNDFHPFVSRDGNRLYFASDRKPNIGGSDLYRADLGGNGFFQTPIRLSELSSMGTNSASPVLSADELTMFFGSTRNDPKAKGSFDVWKATRLTKNDPFGVPVAIPELSTGAVDMPSSISDDGCTIILSSDRAGGQLEVYSATRPK